MAPRSLGHHQLGGRGRRRHAASAAAGSSLVSPFVDLPRMRDAVWIAPRLRAEISYAEIGDGKLRAPSWRGLVRPDAPWNPVATFDDSGLPKNEPSSEISEIATRSAIGTAY